MVHWSTHLFEDVEPGCRALACLQSVQQGLLVNDATASAVHYPHTTLTLGQRLAVDQIYNQSQHSTTSAEIRIIGDMSP